MGETSGEAMGKHSAKQTKTYQNKPYSAHFMKSPESPLFIGTAAISRRSPCFSFVIPLGLEMVLWSCFIYWCFHYFGLLFGETFGLFSFDSAAIGTSSM